MINPAVDDLAELTSIKTACELLGRPRASHYRDRQPPVYGPPRQPAPRPAPPNALTGVEQAEVLRVLTSDRFCDKSVAHTWATLLDEGTYLCSMSTMHRLLRARGAAGERRRQATDPAKKKPELLATGPGQIWSWDITKLRGPDRGIWIQLYVVLDIFSRYVVAWTVQTVEDSGIAKTMLEEAMGVHGIPVAIHADRGTSMTSKPVAQLLLDLGVDRSHSRPRVSNDNPYREAAFKTLKGRPRLPRKLRVPGRRAGLLRGVLRLLQPRAPSFRDRAAHARVGPPRHRRPDPGPNGKPPSTQRTLSPRTVRQPPAPGTHAGQGRLDQPTSPEALIQTA